MRSASTIYDPAYARRYRAHDDEFESSEPCRRFAEWLRQLSAAMTPPIDVLDLGCGTGRYFWALTGVDELVGIDASPAMLAEARVPHNAALITARTVRLSEGDIASYPFSEGRFDLVYSIGVLAEHAPLDASIVARVERCLKPGGTFAFTTVHPDSPSVPRTMKRTIGRAIEAVTPPSLAGPLRERLLARGRYADERRVGELLEPRFVIESLFRFESEAHLHCWCVARKRA